MYKKFEGFQMVDERKRGGRLTKAAVSRLQSAIDKYFEQEKSKPDGRTKTWDNTAEVAGVSPNTVKKILLAKENADISSIKVLWEAYCHSALTENELDSAPDTSTAPNRNSDNVPLKKKSSQSFIDLPYCRNNSYFVGREDLLEEIHQELSRPDNLNIVCLSGLGGIGKTTLVHHYAQRNKKNFNIIFTINACGEDGEGYVHTKEKRAKFRASIAAQLIAKLEPLSSKKIVAAKFDLYAAQMILKQIWKRLAEHHQSILLIFDDVVEFADIRELLPEASLTQFKVLITSRRMIDMSEGRLISVGLLQEDDSLQMLKLILEKDGEPDPRLVSEGAEIVARKILTEVLENLPLGIELVGHYLKLKKNLSLEKALEKLEETPIKAIGLDFDQDAMTGTRGIQAAFDLSWSLLDKNARRLCYTLSLFSKAPIPIELLVKCSLLDSTDIENILDKQLVAGSLVHSYGSSLYRLHSLVREIFAEKLKVATATDSKDCTVTTFCQGMMNEAAEIRDSYSLSMIPSIICSLPHFESFFVNRNLIPVSNEAVIDFFDTVIRIYAMQGVNFLTKQAIFWCSRKESFILEKIGGENIFIVDNLVQVGRLYIELNQYEDAQASFESSLSLAEQLYGRKSNNLILVGIYNGMAELYKAKKVKTKFYKYALLSVNISRSMISSDLKSSNSANNELNIVKLEKLLTAFYLSLESSLERKELDLFMNLSSEFFKLLDLLSERKILPDDIMAIPVLLREIIFRIFITLKKKKLYEEVELAVEEGRMASQQQVSDYLQFSESEWQQNIDRIRTEALIAVEKGDDLYHVESVFCEALKIFRVLYGETNKLIVNLIDDLIVLNLIRNDSRRVAIFLAWRGHCSSKVEHMEQAFSSLENLSGLITEELQLGWLGNQLNNINSQFLKFH
jgi:hypothetical protein